MMRLAGSRNQCGGCREYFNSNAAFEKHRTGKFGVDRRCLTPDEMIAKKMLKNTAGFWTTGAMTPALLEKRHALREQTQTVQEGVPAAEI